MAFARSCYGVRGDLAAFISRLYGVFTACHLSYCASGAFARHFSRRSWRYRVYKKFFHYVYRTTGWFTTCVHSMQAQQIQIAAGAAHLVLQRRRWRMTQRRRMLWVRLWLEAARRFENGHVHILMPELRLENLLESKHTKFARLRFCFVWQAISALPELRGSAVRTPWKRSTYTKSAAKAQ